jgi:hypothetical protein
VAKSLFLLYEWKWSPLDCMTRWSLLLFSLHLCFCFWFRFAICFFSCL